MREIQQFVPEGSFYYNSPLHIVITSPFHSSVPVVIHSDREMSDDEYEARESARILRLETARLRREADDDGRKRIRALEREAIEAKRKEDREAMSEENRKLGTYKSRKRDREIWLDTTPAKRERRTYTTTRVKKPAKPAFVPPEGHLTMDKVIGDIKEAGIILAIGKGYISGVKHGGRWYVHAAQLEAYVASAHERKVQKAKESWAKRKAEST